MDDDKEEPRWLAATLLTVGRRIACGDVHTKIRDGIPEAVNAFVEIPYEQWDGPRGEWAESMGKYGGRVYRLDDGEPVPSCNEIEVAKLLRAGLGYEAFFLTTFRIPGHWRRWMIDEKVAPDWLRKLDGEIRSLLLWPKKKGGQPEDGGMPDVVAWDPSAANPLETAVFVECKGPTEGMRKNQWPWVSAAIELGVSAERFAVALRSF